ncbi:hypothetical protein INR49_003259 [Caranx melampygus]|nr:hypothetical protein INR49_003259 [Caranx melampygus]
MMGEIQPRGERRHSQKININEQFVKNLVNATFSAENYSITQSTAEKLCDAYLTVTTERNRVTPVYE